MHPEKNNKTHAASVSQSPFPIVADPPSTLFTRARTAKNNTKSNINAIRHTAAAIPEIHEEKHDMVISRTCARRPNTAETPAKPSATMCKTSA